MKVILLIILVLSGSPEVLAREGKLVYPPKELIEIAEALEFKDFPKAIDILSIARIESHYRVNARNGVSIGIMQVNRGPKDLVGNVKAGVKILREYYLRLKSVPAAVQAYNEGIGNYLKGKRVPTYLKKWRKAQHEISTYYPSSDTSNNRGNYPNQRGSPLYGPPRGEVELQKSSSRRSKIFEWEDNQGEFREGLASGIPQSVGEVGGYNGNYHWIGIFATSCLHGSNGIFEGSC